MPHPFVRDTGRTGFMIDTRFPWLVPVEQAPIGSVDAMRLSKVCRKVSHRTGRKIAYNRRTRSLYVWFKSVNQGLGWPFEVVRKDGTVTLPDEDDMCAVIWQGQAPQWVKDKWKLQAEKMDEDERRIRSDRHFDSISRDLERGIDRRRNRRGMSSKFRPMAVVNGFK